MKLATYVRKLKDRSGNYVVPATRSTGVYLNNNHTLQSWIDNINTQWTQIDSRLDALEENVSSSISLLDCYPVGAIFQSTSNTSPASLFGGNWEKITNRFLVGAGDSYAVKATGGEEKHTLTTSEMPRHNHVGSDNGCAFLIDLGKRETSNEFAMLNASTVEWRYSTRRGTAYTGDTQPHNNMPPYYAVNIWRRTP